MSPAVTIGVPVYRGAEHLGETVDSILSQTYRDWQVVFSVDGPDPVCERLCAEYLGDPRFRLTVQPQRLGWVRNIQWLQGQADSEFWCYQQQDDVIDATYLEVLVDEALGKPDAAVVYCDMQTFGERHTRFTAPSVSGPPLDRQISLISGQFAGVAFRGLTRVAALKDTGGGLVGNDVDDFAAETVWIATMATWGDLIRVPSTLYHKRYHSGNVHSAWLGWDPPQRARAWIAHCHDMLEVALAVADGEPERWIVWTAILERLTASPATSYLPWAELSLDDRIGMVDGLMERAARLGRIDLETLFSSPWGEIRHHAVGYVTQIDRGLKSPAL